MIPRSNTVSILLLLPKCVFRKVLDFRVIRNERVSAIDQCYVALWLLADRLAFDMQGEVRMCLS
jgi:hypothetical protein